MLYELVYNSVAVPGNPDHDELQRILASSRRFNSGCGVTGVLLYHRGDFVQLLEGERAAVEHIYHDRISRDARHRGLHVCWEQPVERRGFDGWWMGYADPAGAPPLAGFLAGGVEALDLSGPASSGRKLLLSIYDVMQSTTSRSAP